MALAILDPGKTKVDTRAEMTILLLDGMRTRRGPRTSGVALCAAALDREGRGRPLEMRSAPHEDETAWRAFLRDLRRDLGSDPALVGCDGHPALVKAVQAIFPEAPLQISVPSRLLALARKVDPRWRAECLRQAAEIFAAPDRAAAVARFREWQNHWLGRGEVAVRTLDADLAFCLTFYRFPKELWGKIRTVSFVERAFREARRAAAADQVDSSETEPEHQDSGQASMPVSAITSGENAGAPDLMLDFPTPFMAEWLTGTSGPGKGAAAGPATGAPAGPAAADRDAGPDEVAPAQVANGERSPTDSRERVESLTRLAWEHSFDYPRFPTVRVLDPQTDPNLAARLAPLRSDRRRQTIVAGLVTLVGALIGLILSLSL